MDSRVLWMLDVVCVYLRDSLGSEFQETRGVVQEKHVDEKQSF